MSLMLGWLCDGPPLTSCPRQPSSSITITCRIIFLEAFSALFLKYGNKRDGNDGEGTWEVVPRSTAWLDG